MRTSALIAPEAVSAFFLSDSLSVSNGEYTLRFRGTCDGEPMPQGRFGRPVAGSASVLWQATGRLATWTLSGVPVPVRVGDDFDLVASLELTVAPQSSSRGRIEVQATLSDEAPFMRPVEGTPLVLPLSWRKPDQLPAQVIGPATSNGRRLELDASIPQGHLGRWRFLLAGSANCAPMLARAQRTSHAECLARADAAWQARRRHAAEVRLGDPRVEQAVDDALLVLMGCTERRSGHLRPIGNPFQYRDTWIRDAARQISALSQWGDDVDARELAISLLEFRSDAGDIMSQPGQLDGTGEVMWALDEAFSRGCEAALPDSALRAIVLGWHWCERQRDLVRRWVPRFSGLMPPANPRDNELVPGYLFSTDAWTVAGYRAGVDVAIRAGKTALADSIGGDLREYLQAISSRLRARPGHDIPAAWSGSARHWGELSALYPTGAVQASDAVAAGLLALIQADSASRGLATYGSPDSLHTYLGADLATSALVLDRPDLWRAALSRMLSWRTATGGAPELFSASSRSFGGNLPPHAASAAAFLVLLRQGLVFDGIGDTLRLTTGTRSEWWTNGGACSGFATRWGPVDLSFKSTGDKAEWTWSPVPVWTELTLPPRSRQARAIGAGLRSRGAMHLLAPPGATHAEVTCVPE